MSASAAAASAWYTANWSGVFWGNDAAAGAVQRSLYLSGCITSGSGSTGVVEHDLNGRYQCATKDGSNVQTLCLSAQVGYMYSTGAVAYGRHTRLFRVVNNDGSAFSVSANKKVVFSPGNLQYQATTNTWRFAANQWTYIGNAAGNTSPSSSQSNWIDLFGWGTSGVSGYSPKATYYEPWRTTETDNSKYNPYGSMSTNLYDGGANAGKADWGYNFINNNGSLETGWRTLTTDEWKYLFDTRTGDKASTIGSTVNVRYAEGTITGTVSGNINGVFLFPDGGTFATSEFTTVGTLNAASDWTMKVTATQWVALEAKGCAFLPAAGTRYGTSVDNAGSYGLYWTSSFYDTSHHAWSVSFQSDNVTPQNWSGRGRGCSVRLAR